MRILQMSVQAGLLILAIIIIRTAALYRLPKTSFLVLWGVALARMLIPVSISSKWSVYSLFDKAMGGVNTPAFTGKAAVVWSDPPQGQLESTIGQDAVYTISPFAAVWLSGVVVLFLVFAVSLFKNYRKYRFSIPMERNGIVEEWVSAHKLRRPLKIVQSDRVNTPLTLGILRPRIILPKGMDTGDERLMRYVLTHEYIHIRRFDVLWKLVALCAVCIHWFNPLAWVMLSFLNRDLELSCDEMVLRRLGGDERVAYAHSLLAMADRSRTISVVQSCFSRNAAEETKERIIAIMKYKKASVLAVVIAAVAIMGLTTAFAASKSIAPEEESYFLAFIDKTLTEEDARALESTIKAIPNVSEADFISREEAFSDFTEGKDSNMFEEIPDSVMSHRFAVYVADSEQFQDTARQVADLPEITKCAYGTFEVVGTSVKNNGFVDVSGSGETLDCEITKRIHPITGDVSWTKWDYATGDVFISSDEGQTWQLIGKMVTLVGKYEVH